MIKLDSLKKKKKDQNVFHQLRMKIYNSKIRNPILIPILIPLWFPKLDLILINWNINQQF